MDSFESMHPGGLRLTDRAARLAGVTAGMELLDVGCGLGASLAHLSGKFGVRPHGVDISEKLIKSARKRLPNAKFHVEDACSLTCISASYDAVFCECLLSILPKPLAALSQIHRVLRTDGILAVSDVCAKDELSGIQNFLSKTGFVIVHFEEHKSALITYAVQARSFCTVAADDIELQRHDKEYGSGSTYYLAICKRGELV
ncbi:MAG: class I SAM-dependent methyltransferase [Oscillospiraceae bacterium]|nr:class I SAM-dependent methyltransferase [Oscillospiraceae bacterium]